MVYTSYYTVVFNNIKASQHRNNRIVANESVKKLKEIAAINKKIRVEVLLQNHVVKMISAAAAKTGMSHQHLRIRRTNFVKKHGLAVESKDGQRKLSRRRMDIFGK